MVNPTPVPWYIATGAANEPIIQSAAINKDNFICIPEGDTEEQAHANAELIVKAVNNHYEMLETLQEYFDEACKENKDQELIDRLDALLVKVRQ